MKMKPLSVTVLLLLQWSLVPGDATVASTTNEIAAATASGSRHGMRIGGIDKGIHANDGNPTNDKSLHHGADEKERATGRISVTMTEQHMDMPSTPSIDTDESSRLRRRLQQGSVGVLTGLDLIDTLNTKVLTTLLNGQEVVVNNGTKLNVNATFSTEMGPIESVLFGYNARPNFRLENAAPWALCGNEGQPLVKFANCASEFGALVALKGTATTHTVTATPYSGPNGSGIKGATINVTFTLATTPTATVPTALPDPALPIVSPESLASIGNKTDSGLSRLQLIYTGSAPPHLAVMNLTWDTVNIIDLKLLNLPTAKFNLNAVRAASAATTTIVQSVQFSNGHKEGSPPFAYCSNSGKSFATCADLIVGATVKVVVTPYPKKWWEGKALPPRSATLRITDSRLATDPSKSPAVVPSPAPVSTPTKNPVAPPAPKSPVAPPLPTNSPVASAAPSKSSASNSPISASQCTTPKFEGNTWTDGTPYPLKVAEAQGMMVDTSLLVLFGGFQEQWTSVTNATYILDTNEPTATWKRADDFPIPAGLSHGAHILRQSKIYNCGGYVGGHPGGHTAACLVFDHKQPKGKQWSVMTPLPDGRGGGGLFYSTAKDAMFYVSGAQRFSEKGTLTTIDYNTTWMYSFQNNPNNVWVRKADLPYASNHMMAVTTKGGSGGGNTERHFAFGGQVQENEYEGNLDNFYEYNVEDDVWIKLPKMPFGRGHASSSTHPVGCGFVVIGGATNFGILLSDVTYYSTETETWTKLGNLPSALNTPVCDVNRQSNVLYCESGKLWTTNSYKRKLLF